MVVPRRVRRRLLLPPGWVALGLLLLLGCQALQPWAGRVRLWNVIQLTTPKLKPTKKDLKAYGKEYQLPYKSRAELNKVRPWHDVEFKGETLADFLSAAATESAIRKIIADTSHAGGVQIRFSSGATYANLVMVLDIMNYTDQKKYWLDIYHEPITLYAITLKKEIATNKLTPSYLGCCTCGPYLPTLTGEAGWWLEYQKLWLKSWQPTTLLLASISLLSLWSSFRLKTVVNNVS